LTEIPIDFIQQPIFIYLKNLFMTDPTNFSEDTLKKPGRRNWLRNAAMAATGALVLLLVLNGCTKEQWDHLKNPGGGVGGAQDTWYNLKVDYTIKKGKRAVGYLAPVGDNGGTPYYSYMRILDGPATKFRVHPASDGWQYLETDDGLWLTLSYGGFVYRDSQKSVAWKIVDGKLYSDYSRWKDYPATSDLYGGLNGNIFAVEGYYVGVSQGVANELTNCELVPAP